MKTLIFTRLSSNARDLAFWTRVRRPEPIREDQRPVSTGGNADPNPAAPTSQAAVEPGGGRHRPTPSTPTPASNHAGRS